MVMEEAPSPNCVGHEFVRKYYTLMNQAPMHLHRFYNDKSSFVHGVIDTPSKEMKPAIGQQEIHQRIQELAFNDCHAKIRQVDSQLTLGNGVVVQVIGELSNNGEPMRRFTQTFVLAQQGPRSYYVHNDIFRYQDELIAEEDYKSEYDCADVEEAPKPAMEAPEMPAVQQHTAVTTPPQVQSVSTTNGSAHHEEVIPRTTTHSTVPEPPVVSASPVATPPSVVNSEPPVTISEEKEVEVLPPVITTPTEPEMPVPAPPENKTYANLFKPKGPAPPSIMSTASRAPLLHTEAMYTQSGGEPGMNSMGSADQSMDNHRPKSGRGGRGPGGRPRPGPPPTQGEERSSKGNGGSARLAFPDSQMLFIGNMPNGANEANTREAFAKFGSIIDIRINSKPSNKVPPGKTPKFGFIVFSDPKSVQQCLQNKPIMMTLDGQEYTLNIEEKRTKPRPEGRHEDRDRGRDRPSELRSGPSGGGGGGGMKRGGRGGSSGEGGGPSRGGRGGMSSGGGGGGGPRGGNESGGGGRGRPVRGGAAN